MEKFGYYNMEDVPLETLKEVRESRKKGAAGNTEFRLPNLFNYFTKKQLSTDLVSQANIENYYRDKIGRSKYTLERSIEAIKKYGLIRTGVEAMIKNVYDDG